MTELLKSACVIVRNKEDPNLVLVVSRGDDHTQWGIPGGKGEGNEDFAQTAVRELYEETSVYVTNLQEVLTYRVDDTNYECCAFLSDDSWTGTPAPSHEGIVDWQPLEFLTNPKNSPFSPYFKNTVKVLEDMGLYSTSTNKWMPVVKPKIHDYMNPTWGHSFNYYPIGDTIRGRMSGWGYGLRVGDYIKSMGQSGDPTHNKIETLSYYRDPRDMWKADVVWVPLNDLPGEDEQRDD